MLVKRNESAHKVLKQQVMSLSLLWRAFMLMDCHHMVRKYQPPQVLVLDDTSHISLPSSMELPNNMTSYGSDLHLGLPDLGIGSTFSDGFDLGSSSMAQNFVNDDDSSDFNLYPPLKKMRTSWSNLEEICLHLKTTLKQVSSLFPFDFFCIWCQGMSLFYVALFHLHIWILVHWIGYQPNLNKN